MPNEQVILAKKEKCVDPVKKRWDLYNSTNSLLLEYIVGAYQSSMNRNISKEAYINDATTNIECFIGQQNNSFNLLLSAHKLGVGDLPLLREEFTKAVLVDVLGQILDTEPRPADELEAN